MKALLLEAQKRTITGRKVKNLRNKGVLPGTVYGKATEPISVQIDASAFANTFKQTGETGLINLMIDKDAHPVLIKNVQRDPVTNLPTHLEFHQVNLKEKIHANVPIILTGESQAIKEKVGTLLLLLSEIEVEALPTDLPEHVEVDISNLVNVNDHIVVKELIIPVGVTLLTDPEIMVVKISELLAPEPEPEPTPTPVEGEAVEGEKGEEAKVEGEEKEPAEGKKEAPEKPEETPKKE